MKGRNKIPNGIYIVFSISENSLFTSEDTRKKKKMLLRILRWNIIGVRDPIVCSVDYSDDTRLARANAFQFRLSPVDCIEPNFVGGRTSGRRYACIVPYMRTLVSVVKDFIVMNLIFIQTVLPVLSLSLSFARSLSLSSCFSNTRTECYVPMQTWFAGYLERNKGSEHFSKAPYLGWLSVIQ